MLCKISIYLQTENELQFVFKLFAAVPMQLGIVHLAKTSYPPGPTTKWKLSTERLWPSSSTTLQSIRLAGTNICSPWHKHTPSWYTYRRARCFEAWYFFVSHLTLPVHTQTALYRMVWRNSQSHKTSAVDSWAGETSLASKMDAKVETDQAWHKVNIDRSVWRTSEFYSA